MTWQPTETGHRCDKHGESFDRGEVCSLCVVAPDVAPGAPQLSEDVDLEISALARDFTSRARLIWRNAAAMLEGTPMDKIQSAKLSAESVKWERLALEAKDKVAARKHLREAMAHEREMSGVRH